MAGLAFEEDTRVVTSNPNRLDVACFVGFVARRPGTGVSREILQWLHEHGWPARGGDTSPRAKDIEARAIAQEPLTDEVPAFKATDRLDLRIDGATQTVRLPERALSRYELAIELSRRIRGGYAGLSDDGRLVIGSDGRGPGAEVCVERMPALGFRFPTTARGYAEPAGLEELLDVPVPIDSWETFQRLFLWDDRPVQGRRGVAATHLGAAVRSFFAQGGRKCYVLRVGEPLDVGSRRAERLETLSRLAPGYRSGDQPSPEDRASWSGIGHLLGLPDVSFVCLPDLPEAVSIDPQPLGVPEMPPPVPQEFVDCSPEPATAIDRAVRNVPASYCDAEGYEEWSMVLRHVVGLISRRCREVQLIAAVPIPRPGTPAEMDLLGYLIQSGILGSPDARGPQGVASAFLQLAYPWLATPVSSALPGQVENPEGALAGMLAQTAIGSGAYRSAAGLSPLEVSGLFPVLSREQTLKAHRDPRDERSSTQCLQQRVSLFASTPAGLSLLSDVTTSLDETYRPASVNRLVSVIVRAARRLGEDLVFENSGPALWSRVRSSLNLLMLGLYLDNALVGATAEDAYTVRCDRTTTSQDDLDSGRVVCQVDFAAAASIERISVVMSLEEGGQVSLLTGQAAVRSS